MTDEHAAKSLERSRIIACLSLLTLDELVRERAALETQTSQRVAELDTTWRSSVAASTEPLRCEDCDCTSASGCAGCPGATPEAELSGPRGHVLCRACGHRWVAVATLLADLTRLECPSCHADAGEMGYRAHGDSA